MALIDKTIYPVLPNNLPQKVIAQHYTLSADELEFTVNKTLNINSQICFAILFKIYQKLGYFVDIHKCPEDIVTHVSTNLKAEAPSDYDLFCYDRDRIKDRHLVYIRQYFKCTIATSKITTAIATKIANTKSSLIDVINGTIEELIAGLYELPEFITLERICAKARRVVNSGYYELIYKNVTRANKKYIKENILIYGDNGESNWQLLKQEPPKISINNIREFSKHRAWLKQSNISPAIFNDIPQVKLDSLFEEGYSYNFFEIKRLKQEKKISLIALVIHQQLLSATDDLIYMLTKHINDMEQDSKRDLEEYILTKLDQAEMLVNTFKDVLSEYKKNKSTAKLKSMTPVELEELIQSCDEYNAYSKHKNLYFLFKRHVKNRHVILRCINMLEIDDSSPAVDTVKMLKYLKKIYSESDEQHINIKDGAFSINWLPARWRSFCKLKGNKVDKVKFEAFVIVSLAQGLKDREIFIDQSRSYTNYKNKLITWAEYREKIRDYSEITNLPTEATSFTIHVKNDLRKSFDSANDILDVKENADIKNGKLIAYYHQVDQRLHDRK